MHIRILIVVLLGCLVVSFYAYAAEGPIGRPVRVVSVAMFNQGVEKTAQVVDREAGAGADLVLLTEVWTGEEALPNLDAPAIATMAALAKKHRTYIVSPREDWYMLKAVRPGVDLPALVKRYDLQELHDYLNKQRLQADRLRGYRFKRIGPEDDERQEDSPIFAAETWLGNATSTAPQKSGQSPVNGYVTDNQGFAEAPKTAAGSVDHSRLMEYQSPDGRLLPVRTAEDWAKRRSRIIAGMEAAMGRLPDRSKLPPPEVKVLGRVEGEGFVRLDITYLAEANDRVPALLYLPKNRPDGRRVPAILALHPTSRQGKKGIAVEENAPPNRGYATELARRGYVVLAPDYPSFGDYPCDFAKSKFASGTMKGIFNHVRGVDLLAARDEVDAERIGVIGHSLGGHNAMFLGAFDPRVKVIIASCGWTPFHYYYGGKLDGWAQDRYMPRLRDRYGLDPDRVPFDFYEVAAALAPRAFLSCSPLRDDNFDVAGVKKAESKIRQVYKLLGAADRLQFTYPDCEHDFPPEIRRAAYRFIDRILHHVPAEKMGAPK